MPTRRITSNTTWRIEITSPSICRQGCSATCFSAIGQSPPTSLFFHGKRKGRFQDSKLLKLLRTRTSKLTPAIPTSSSTYEKVPATTRPFDFSRKLIKLSPTSGGSSEPSSSCSPSSNSTANTATSFNWGTGFSNRITMVLSVLKISTSSYSSGI